jgi:hypothetical protein
MLVVLDLIFMVVDNMYQFLDIIFVRFRASIILEREGFVMMLLWRRIIVGGLMGEKMLKDICGISLGILG